MYTHVLSDTNHYNVLIFTDHIQAIVTVFNNVLSPRYASSWAAATDTEFTRFSLTNIPPTLHQLHTLFRLYGSSGISLPHMAVRTVLNITRNFSGGVVYVGVVNNTVSSVILPSDLTKNMSSLHHLDFVVGAYPTVGLFLTPPPSQQNMTIVTTVVSVQLWNEAGTVVVLSTPLTITLAHTREVIDTHCNLAQYTILQSSVYCFLYSVYYILESVYYSILDCVFKCSILLWCMYY